MRVWKMQMIETLDSLVLKFMAFKVTKLWVRYNTGKDFSSATTCVYG
jgi:hypothetical protein